MGKGKAAALATAPPLTSKRGRPRKAAQAADDVAAADEGAGDQEGGEEEEEQVTASSAGLLHNKVSAFSGTRTSSLVAHLHPPL